MGTVDKAIRLIAAAVIFALYFMNIITGTVAIVLLVLAAVFVVTSFVSFCPLYKLFGIKTTPEEKV